MVSRRDKREISKAMSLLKLLPKSPRTAEEALDQNFEFWSTQPVPKMGEVVTTNEAIEPDVAIELIRKDPYTLPTGFVWDTLDLEDPSVLKELYDLISENFVEGDNSMFRFDHSPEFLKWALKPPGWKQDLHCGVRVAKNKKLVGFVAAIPATISVHGKLLKTVQADFLCVHTKLRLKRVAPVLMREITRRVNQHGIFQGVYTAAVVLPKPIVTCSYWHRSLNPKKLLESGFCYLSTNMTLQRCMKLFKLPAEPKCGFLRPLTKNDVPAAHALLRQYLGKFKLRPEFGVDQLEHWFIPKKEIMETYVVERDGEITDMFSFYAIPSTVVNNPVHKSVKAAYCFYNVATSLPLEDLMNDALVIAKNAGFDVFSALDLMDNKAFLESLKFGKGDGYLQYYLYNWKCPSVTTSEIGLVLP